MALDAIYNATVDARGGRGRKYAEDIAEEAVMKFKSILLAILVVGLSGCVSRTTTRRPNVSEMSRGSGPIKTTKIIWIWEREFWR